MSRRQCPARSTELPAETSDADHSRADISKVRLLLGHRPQIDLESGLGTITREPDTPSTGGDD